MVEGNQVRVAVAEMPRGLPCGNFPIPIDDI